MAKRKRNADQELTPRPRPSDYFMPFSSQIDWLSRERSPHSSDNRALKPLSSIMEIMDSSVKLQTPHHSHVQHHHGLGRSIMLRHPRRYFGRHYYRRNSANYSDASTSHPNSNPTFDEKQTFKLSDQCSTGSGPHTESREISYHRPERIRSCSLGMGAITPDVVKMVCGICQKLLERKPCFLENAINLSDVSVVAVLACGHVYHADCLEHRTCQEHIQDPPCPLCLGLLLQADVS